MTKLVQLYAGPGSWGPKVQIQSVFGANVWCSFEEAESNTGGPTTFQYWSSDTKKWSTAIEGQKLFGQSIWLSAKALGTGGYIKLRISGTAITALVYSAVKIHFAARAPLQSARLVPFQTIDVEINGQQGATDVPYDPDNTSPVLLVPERDDGTVDREGAVVIEFPNAMENESRSEPEAPPEDAGDDGGGDDGGD